MAPRDRGRHGHDGAGGAGDNDDGDNGAGHNGAGDAPTAAEDDFSSDELETLRDFFRDEAHEAFERLTASLLGAGDTSLPEATVTEMMRATHTLKGSAGTVNLPELVTYAHAVEDELARLRSGQIPWSIATRDQLVELFDALRSLVDARGIPAAVTLARRRVDALIHALASRASASAPDVPENQPVSSPVVLSDGVVAPYQDSDDPRSIVTGPMVAVAEPGERTRTGSVGILRVDASRIDRLMDAVGQLVVDRTRIERRVDGLRALAHRLAEAGQGGQGGQTGLAEPVAELTSIAAGLDDEIAALARTTASLQSGLTRVRMSSARSLFGVLTRQLRTIAREAGKAVDLVTSGDDTEFDKTVAERVTDSLVQLLRNAVAHGIEPEAMRRSLGKNPRGQVRIDARQEGREVVLDVCDDGAGIDPALLRERFVAAGLWTRARAELCSDEDVLAVIFDPGTSTRPRADTLAGRGVGLDTVRETIVRLGGSIRLTSTPGRGTQFTIRLPVSTAVSQAYLFKVGSEVYAIPNVHVLATTEVAVDQDSSSNEHDDGDKVDAPVRTIAARLPGQVELRGARMPLVCLQELLYAETLVAMPVLPVIVLDYAGKKLAITCDKRIGPREIIVKELGPLLAPLPLYAGGTISGSGKVQLILDPAALIRLAEPEPAAALPTPPPGKEKEGVPLPDLPRIALGPGARVLVVDDSRAVRDAVANILTSRGFLVEVARDGVEAWTMLERDLYELLITDLEMPSLAGFELIERVRGSDRLAGLPVVILSSRADVDSRERAWQLGVARFLVKPITAKKLLTALSAL